MRGIRVIKALGRSPEQIQEYSESVDALQVREYGRSMLVARVAPVPGPDCGCLYGGGAGCGRFAGCGGYLESGRDDRLLCGADRPCSAT